MTTLVKHRDLLSAGLSLGFVVFVLASVLVKTLTHSASADAHIGPAVTSEPESTAEPTR